MSGSCLSTLPLVYIHANMVNATAVISRTSFEQRGRLHQDYQPLEPKKCQHTWAAGTHYTKRCKVFIGNFLRHVPFYFKLPLTYVMETWYAQWPLNNLDTYLARSRNWNNVQPNAFGHVMQIVSSMVLFHLLHWDVKTRCNMNFGHVMPMAQELALCNAKGLMATLHVT